MVKTKTKKVKKTIKNSKTKKKKVEEESEEETEEESGGTSLDDAFGDDEDVEYAESKPRKEKKIKGIDEDELDEEIDELERKNGALSMDSGEYEIKSSKNIRDVKKGDKIKVDGNELIVDAHYVLIDHGSTKEMTIEVFDSKNDKDYQIRYFSDQVESTLEFYELQEIMYIKRAFKKIEW